MPKKTVQVQIVDPDYSELEVLDLLSRPNEEAPNCVGLGGIDHMINIHYPVVVDGKNTSGSCSCVHYGVRRMWGLSNRRTARVTLLPDMLSGQ